MEKLQKNYTASNLNPEDLELFKSIFDYSELRGAFIGNKNESIEAHYIRVYGFRYWDSSSIEEYDNKALDFNSKTKNAKIEITSYDDYEVEWDNDRSYPASFQLMIKPNN